MGLDLTLAPDGYGGLPNYFLAYSRIDLDRDYDIFAQISRVGSRRADVRPVCDPKPLPEKMKFQWYGDEGLQERTDDPYGDPIRYVLAGELAKVEAGDSTGWNKAAFAFIRALAPDTVVVLWWH